MGLKQAGFAVDNAGNGEDGFHLALTEPYDARQEICKDLC